MLALAASPATYLVALVPVLAGIGHLLGVFKARFSIYAGLALLAYVVSTLAQDAWRLGDTIEMQIAWWQCGIFVSALTYQLILAWRDPSMSWLTLSVLVAMAFATFQIPMEAVALQKLAECALILVVASFCFFVVTKIPRHDFLAHTLWVVLLVYEILGLALYADCQILHEFRVPRELGSACDRKYDSPVSWLLLVLIGLTIAYLLGRRWLQPKA